MKYIFISQTVYSELPVRLRYIRGALAVRRSKLEMYVDILKVLAQEGPLKLTHLMYETNVNCSILNEYLDFLVKQNLVEERKIGVKRAVFAITQRGTIVLKYFEELRQILPLIEDETNSMPISIDFQNTTDL